MKKEWILGFESLDGKVLLSSNPWYVDATKAEALWSLPKTNNPIVVVVDSGIDLNSSSLRDKVWVNPYDVPDGIDNDNNGYVDDTNGWNFAINSNSIQDNYFHGTAVAGVINTISNGGVTIMPLKFMDDSGIGYTGDAIKAINYAVDMKLRGANIISINCSFGGTTGGSSLLASAIQRASDNGILVITAAGNSSSDNDLIPRYPSSYSYANTISVAATNSDLTLAGYSNYGKNSVDMAAPGSGMYTNIPYNSYSYVSGTSFSAPMISGAAALLKSFGDYTASAIKNALMIGSDLLSGLADKVKSGFLNISKAYEQLTGQVAPVVVIASPSQPVVSPSPLVQINELVYGFKTVSKKEVCGWANITNSSSKPTVEIYINGRLRYSVIANQYRSGSYSNDMFRLKLHKKFFNLKSNLLEIRIIDSSHGLNQLVYSGRFKR